ncbi:hypothetical protein BVRB_8g198520 [Beta vulgaris subsp. vulgaris]|nr:hypothetical protein BVRB_8g198520 [Beta vulgaris subsp. vulgaris]
MFAHISNHLARKPRPPIKKQPTRKAYQKHKSKDL